MTDIKIGEIVWAKMIGHSHWPCVVLKGKTELPKPSKDPKKKYFWVYFFGSNNYAWIPKRNISLYETNKDKYKKPPKKNNLLFNEAVEEAESHLRHKKVNPNYKVVIKKKFKIKELEKNTKRSDSRIKLPKSPSIKDGVNYKEVIRTGEIRTSKLIFAVIGTGIIGREIVKKLTISGHKVNIWNRTRIKCDSIIQELGKRYKKKLIYFNNARDLLEESNIVFICVSDEEAVKDVFQRSFSINNSSDNILENKGIIQVTTTSPEFSKYMKAVVEIKGGKYLEAQIQGSKQEAKEGQLIILAAGDVDLFFNCQSCFKAIAGVAMYLGEVGYASKLNLILQLIKGVNLAILVESMAFAERCNVTELFLKILIRCESNSPYLIGKALKITEKTFGEVEQPLKHLQRDLKLGLDLSDNEKQPMFLATIVNELLKHCMRLEYNDHDVAVLYMRNKH